MPLSLFGVWQDVDETEAGLTPSQVIQEAGVGSTDGLLLSPGSKYLACKQVLRYRNDYFFAPTSGLSSIL
jgi:hypothetical protein